MRDFGYQYDDLAGGNFRGLSAQLRLRHEGNLCGGSHGVPEGVGLQIVQGRTIKRAHEPRQLFMIRVFMTRGRSCRAEALVVGGIDDHS